MKTLLLSFGILFFYISAFGQIFSPGGRGGGGGGGGGSLNLTSAWFQADRGSLPQLIANSPQTVTNWGNVISSNWLYRTTGTDGLFTNNFPGYYKVSADVIVQSNTWTTLILSIQTNAPGIAPADSCVTYSSVHSTNSTSFNGGANAIHAEKIVFLPTNWVVSVAMQCNTPGNTLVTYSRLSAELVQPGLGGSGNGSSVAKENGVTRSSAATAYDFQNGTNIVARVVDTSGTEGVQYSLSPMIQGSLVMSNGSLSLSNTTTSYSAVYDSVGVSTSNTNYIYSFKGTNIAEWDFTHKPFGVVNPSLIPIRNDVDIGSSDAQYHFLYVSNIASSRTIVDSGSLEVYGNSSLFGSVIAGGVGASKLVRTDANSNLTSVTIGSGITFDGTTLSASGGSATVPQRTYQLAITMGQASEVAYAFSSNNVWTHTFTGTPNPPGERYSFMWSNAAPVTNIVTFNGITPWDIEAGKAVSNLILPATNVVYAVLEYNTNQTAGWYITYKTTALPYLTPAAKTTLTTNGNQIAINVKNLWPAGAGSSNYAAGAGILYWSTVKQTTIAANTETTLGGTIIDTNTLANNGDAISATWSVKLKNNTGGLSNQFRIYWGSVVVVDTGLLPTSNGTVNAWVEVTKTGSLQQHVDATIAWSADTGAPYAYTNKNIEATMTDSTTNTLALKGIDLVAGSHTNNNFRVYYAPGN